MGMFVIALWTAALSTGYFLIMKRLNKFRIDETIEIIGLDIAEMGGLSKNLFEKIKQDNVLQSPQLSMLSRAQSRS